MTSLSHAPAHRRFTLLYTADVIVEWFAAIALMVLVYEQTGSTTASALLLVCKQVVPGALVPVVGSRFEGKSLERPLALALATQAAALASMSFVGYGALLLALAGLGGLAGGVVRSTLRAGMARRLDDDALAAGNASLNVALGIAGIAGPAMAAAVVGAASASLALALGCAALLLLMVASSGMSMGVAREAQAEDEALAPRTGGATAIPLFALLAVVAAVMAMFSMDEPALLAFSDVSLGAGVGGYGAIVLGWGLGITVGSIIFTRLTGWAMLRVYVVATLIAGVGYVGMGLSPTIEIAVGFAILGGIGNGMDWVAIVTLVQQATPRGRETWAATRLEAIATSAPGVGILAGGLLADVASPRIALLAPGVVAILVIAAGAAFLRLRSTTRATPAAPAAERTLVPSIHGGSA